jgi:hypothetical protein
MMMNLQEILNAIDRLSTDDREKVYQHLEKSQATPQWRHRPEDSAKRIAALDAAIEGFWEGYTEAEVDEIIEAITREDWRVP